MAVPGTALPGTAAGTSAGALYFTRAGVREGNYTATVYKLIAEHKFADAAQVLALELQSFPRSRAALSLLAFCYYHMQVCLSALCNVVEVVLALFPWLSGRQPFLPESISAGLSLCRPNL
jgi:hypothetical protein